ncbi:MAG: DnaJ domain-containing protein [Bacteroidetes bacterium]|nr:DnaJ domain-containing protein [Bacteroidota bacterium]
MLPDYYKILDISRNASVDEIKQAYRNKAKLYHPDINRMPDSKAVFQSINEAYQVLINFDKRRWYDFKLKYPSSTGLRPQNKQRTSNNEANNKAYYQQQRAKQEEREADEYTRKKVDYFLFYFLIIAGFAAIIFSIIDLFDDEKKEKTYGGLVFGIWFLGVMFYGWNLLKKPSKKI